MATGTQSRRRLAQALWFGGPQVLSCPSGTAPDPPKALNPAEAAVWRRVIVSMPAGWLSTVPALVLVAYCRHVVRVEMLIQEAASLDPDEFRKPGGLRRLGLLLGKAERARRAEIACAHALRLPARALHHERGS